MADVLAGVTMTEDWAEPWYRLTDQVQRSLVEAELK
jgi:hypothetical protein